MKKLNRKGFTLIEILVVVAIIGILAGVVLVGLRGTGPAARDSRRASELKSVQSGLELFYNKMGTYPMGTSAGAMDWDDLSTALINANIGITQVPNDPQNASGATYEYGSNGTSYILKATLEVGDNSLLSADVDADTFGLDCDAQNTANPAEEIAYCIQL